jgi:Ca2+/H+ antiporter, TMEM165/GDT1 family
LFEAFLVSTGAVALAEIGDKTQLLALVLAARFRRPLPVIAAIFVATLINHSLAGVVGAWVASLLGPTGLRWVLGISFVAMAIWTLLPEQEEANEAPPLRFGVFVTTLIAFFLAEIGDKSQIATVVMAAHYDSLIAVVGGAILGEMIAIVPAVWLGEVAATKLPLKLVRGVVAGIFLILGIFILLGVNFSLGT